MEVVREVLRHEPAPVLDLGHLPPWPLTFVNYLWTDLDLNLILASFLVLAHLPPWPLTFVDTFLLINCLDKSELTTYYYIQ